MEIVIPSIVVAVIVAAFMLPDAHFTSRLPFISCRVEDSPPRRWGLLKAVLVIGLIVALAISVALVIS